MILDWAIHNDRAHPQVGLLVRTCPGVQDSGSRINGDSFGVQRCGSAPGGAYQTDGPVSLGRSLVLIPILFDWFAIAREPAVLVPW